MRVSIIGASNIDVSGRSAALVAPRDSNPIPEEYPMDPDYINGAIDEAVKEAEALGIHGKATTPFLLAKIKDITGGDSLEANIKLVLNNAALAAKTAAELAKA